jgi:hypothetical protein
VDSSSGVEIGEAVGIQSSTRTGLF